MEDAKKQKLSILLHEKEQLVRALSQKEAQILTKNFRERFVLDDHTSRILSSLDYDSLDRKVLVRYLLKIVYTHRNIDVAWKSFLIFIENMGGNIVFMQAILKESLIKSKNGDSSNSENQLNNTLLVEEDVGLLTELLGHIAYKWEQIATALDIPSSKKGEIRQKNNVVLCLNKVVEAWILRQCAAARPTLGTLRKAISSTTVSEFKRAEELIQNFQNSKPNLFSTSIEENDSFQIINQSTNPVTVADGKSIILQVQASPQHSVSYQWKKNDGKLQDDFHYSGVHEDLLVIINASQGMEGEYTCSVTYEGELQNSNKISLTVQYSHAKKHLLNVYKKQKEVPVDFWPPFGTNKFIDLELLKCSLDGTDETDSLGEASIEYNNIFGSFESGALILIKGRPGSGKTTLLNKIVKDWTEGLTLKGSEHVFLISLRDFNKTEVKTISDVLQCCFENIACVGADIEKNDGEINCFILDGFDEFDAQDINSSFVYMLIKKKYLPQSMVIVSSRQVTSNVIERAPLTMNIEIFGFTNDKINDYLDCFPFKATVPEQNFAVSELKEYFKSHPNVHNWCYLPVNLVMICFLSKRNGKIPNTRTKIYEEVTRLILLRHLRRGHETHLATPLSQNEKEPTLECLQDLRGETREIFKGICHLAFNKTVKSQAQTANVKQSLGLLTIKSVPGLFGMIDTYTFSHLTFQEFLAAYYIAKINDGQDQVKIERILKNASPSTVLFFCGLASENCYLNVIDNASINEVYTMHCAFESQQQLACDRVVKNFDGRITLSRSLSPSDVSAVAFVINNTSLPVTEISLGFYRETNHALLHLNEDSFKHLKSLKVSYPGDSEIRDLSIIIRKCKNISQVTLYLAKIEANSAKDMALVLAKSEKLEELHLSFKNCLPGVIETMLVNLKDCKNVNIHLEMKCITKAFDAELMNGLPYIANNHVQKLRLCYNKEDTEHTYCSAYTALKSLKQIVRVEVRGYGNVIQFCEWPSHFETDLYKLVITNMHFNSGSGTYLADYFKFSKKLITLDLSDNKLSSMIFEDVAAGFQHLVNLKYLYLSGNNIEPSGAAVVADNLHNLANLENLRLDNNNIGSIGVRSLSKEIHHLLKLTTLNLAQNGIDIESTIELLQELRHCKLLRVVNISSSNLKNGIHVENLVELDDRTSITKLKDALKRHPQERKLYLGFDTITVAISGAQSYLERIYVCNLI